MSKCTRCASEAASAGLCEWHYCEMAAGAKLNADGLELRGGVYALPSAEFTAERAEALSEAKRRRARALASKGVAVQAPSAPSGPASISRLVALAAPDRSGAMDDCEID